MFCGRPVFAGNLQVLTILQITSFTFIIQTWQTDDLLDGASAPSLIRVRPALNDLFDDLDPAG
jgi:hypothetical protein